MRRLTTAQSAAASSALEILVYLALYVVHLLASGTFALPAGVLAVLLPLTPVIDYVGTWLLRGLSGAGWDLPLPFPSPQPGPLPGPQPPVGPPSPPAA